MPSLTCACGSGRVHDDCCGPYLAGWAQAPTAEALMRSRYCAYAHADIDYLEQTSGGEAKAEFSRRDATAWANNATFTKLEVHDTVAGGPDDTTGIVEFTATYIEQNKTLFVRERSKFAKEGGLWRYTGRERATPVKSTKTAGRNDPCPCGSGLKFKKCCG